MADKNVVNANSAAPDKTKLIQKIATHEAQSSSNKNRDRNGPLLMKTDEGIIRQV